MAKDPVCGMEVDQETAAAQLEYNGKRYFFCCRGCLTSFSKEPEKYLGIRKERGTDDSRHKGHREGNS